MVCQSRADWGTQGKENSGKQMRAMSKEPSVGRSSPRKDGSAVPGAIHTEALWLCSWAYMRHRSRAGQEELILH